MVKHDFKINWNVDHGRSKKVVQGSGLKQTHKDYWLTFWPMTEDYFSPYSAIFATMGFERSEIQQRKSWLLRDGFIPLLWFLNENSPKSFGADILLPYEFMPFTPKPWKSKASYYQYASLHNEPRSHVLVLLNTHPMLVSEEEFELQMNSLEKHLKNLKIKGDLLLCARPVGPGVHGFERSSYVLNQVVEFTKRFGSQVSFIDWSLVTQNINCKNFYSFEFNNKLIISDTFTSQYVLSKGAIPLDFAVVKKVPDLSVPLSLHHKINLFADHSSKVNLQNTEQQSAFYKKLVSLSYQWEQSVPWPLDINAMLRAAIRKKNSKA